MPKSEQVRPLKTRASNSDLTAKHQQWSSIHMEKADIREHLAEADKKIADAEMRIADQRDRIKTLAVDGHPTEAAEKLLNTYNKVLEVMVQHKETIISELETQQSIDSTH